LRLPLKKLGGSLNIIELINNKSIKIFFKKTNLLFFSENKVRKFFETLNVTSKVKKIHKTGNDKIIKIVREMKNIT